MGRKKISDPLARVMRKVARGEKLTKKDREILSAARDAMNIATRGKDPLARAMSKVAKGQKLTAADKIAISGAIDAVEPSKKRKKGGKRVRQRKC